MAPTRKLLVRVYQESCGRLPLPFRPALPPLHGVFPARRCGTQRVHLLSSCGDLSFWSFCSRVSGCTPASCAYIGGRGLVVPPDKSPPIHHIDRTAAAG